MNTWKAMKERLLEDESRRAAYDELEQRMRLVRAVVVARNARGWSQRELADAAGLKQPAVARFEKADTDPRLGTVTKILNALELQLTIDPDGIANAAAPKRERVTGRGKVLSPAPAKTQRAARARAKAPQGAVAKSGGQVGDTVRVSTRTTGRTSGGVEFTEVKTSGGRAFKGVRKS